MKGALTNIKKRPVLLIFIMLVGAAFCVAEQFNSLTKEFGSFNRIFKYDYVTLLSELANWLHSKATSPALMAVSIVIAAVTAVAIGAILGVLCSGYAYTLYVTVITDGKTNGRRGKRSGTLFAEGINRRFGKMTAYFVVLILTSAVMTGLTAYSVMPAAMSIKNVIGGDTGSLLNMVLLTSVTVLILFFAIMFFVMYMSFLMPSIIAFRKGSVKVALRMVNAYCWYLIPRTFAFLIYIAAVTAAMLAASYGGSSAAGQVIALLLNWLLKSAGLYVYTYYVFSTYAAMKEDMFGH